MAKDLKDRTGHFVDLFQENYVNKQKDTKSLIYIDVLRTPDSMVRGYGRVGLFEGDDFTIINQDHFKPGSLDDCAFKIPKQLSYISYNIDPFSEWEDLVLPAERFCHVNWVVTNEKTQGKGYANFILKHFIDSTFLMSSTIGFISAEIRWDNGASRKCFIGLGFVEFSRKITLDGGETFITDEPKLEEDNFYLSRFEWNKRRSERSESSTQ